MYEYRIEISIFGQKKLAKVKAASIMDAVFKIQTKLLLAVQVIDAQIFDLSGNELQEEDLKRQVEAGLNDILKNIKPPSTFNPN